MNHTIINETTLAEGYEHLRAADPIMARLIAEYGPYSWKAEDDYFAVLCGSIVSQQLSVKAAASIAERVLRELGGQWKADALLAAPEEEMRALGLSRSKVVYLKDLAAHCAEGRLHLHELPSAANEEVIARLTMVKGIGRWTAEMFLLFGMGRMNVFPVGDLGIKKAIQSNYNLPDLPDKKQMLERAAIWAPYESIATLYLWRSLNNKPSL
ncbi:DNA-3-methyladenine glycosylase 2 family protein [Aneurinibacillus sp. BA2021]|nr:DNA-3-methyladenine glycosylase 2 family protein [Aneurinibacillus sp. BA2021]